MEFSARYTLAGLFVLATLFGLFGFIYWLTNSAGIGETAPYRIRFPVPVSGLSEGSDVLFNGIKIGEITALRFDRQSPEVTIADADLSTLAPLHADTTVGIAFQGLTGAASVLMTGGSAEAGPPLAGADGVPTMQANPSASRSWTDNAGRVLGRLDDLLSKNSGRFDAILAGLERLAGGGGEDNNKGVYDLPVPEFATASQNHADWQLVVAEPTILLSLNTDKVQVKDGDASLSPFKDAKWTDNLPNLLQAKLIRAFEDAGFARSIMRPADVFEPELRLVIDIRDFHFQRDGLRAQAKIMAKLVDQNGQVLASRLLSHESEASSEDETAVIQSLQGIFSDLTSELVDWAVAGIERRNVLPEVE